MECKETSVGDGDWGNATVRHNRDEPGPVFTQRGEVPALPPTVSVYASEPQPHPGIEEESSRQGREDSERWHLVCSAQPVGGQGQGTHKSE